MTNNNIQYNPVLEEIVVKLDLNIGILLSGNDIQLIRWNDYFAESKYWWYWKDLEQ